MLRLATVTSVALIFAEPIALAFPRGFEKANVLPHARAVEDAYDYVIVGAGTAGLTIADRLTENPATTVLVIEVGEVSM
jgi:choline dehydrogenase